MLSLVFSKCTKSLFPSRIHSFVSLSLNISFNCGYKEICAVICIFSLIGCRELWHPAPVRMTKHSAFICAINTLFRFCKTKERQQSQSLGLPLSCYRDCDPLSLGLLFQKRHGFCKAPRVPPIWNHRQISQKFTGLSYCTSLFCASQIPFCLFFVF